MNNNIILNSFLLIDKKLVKLLKFDNYFGKLLCILYFNDLYSNIKSKKFYSEYKLFYSLDKILIKFDLKLDIKIYPPERLHLNYNNIKAITSEIGNLINLKFLTIQNNKNLTFLPVQLGKLINLRKLYLSNNKLKIIPTQLGNLINLEALWLYNNKLKIIPNQIGNLINLKFLYLENNLLKTIPIQLNNLINLKVLSILGNLLVKIEIDLTKYFNLINFWCNEQQYKLLSNDNKNHKSIHEVYKN
jgi:hypothetical protein